MNGECGIERLFQDIAELSRPEEFKALFEDLCTPAELKSLADRWRVAKLLETGDFSYRSINEKTGVSTTTITRVARSMTYGAKGYRILLDKINKR